MYGKSHGTFESGMFLYLDAIIALVNSQKKIFFQRQNLTFKGLKEFYAEYDRYL